MVGGVWEAAFVGSQPSYPFLVLQSWTSVPPLLTVHSVLNLAACSGLGARPNSCAHPTPCSSGLSMMRESLVDIRLGVEGEETMGAVMIVSVIDWRFASCTESQAVDLLRCGVEGALLISVGVILRSDSVSDDGKTRSRGTSSPSFLRSLSIFCLRRLLRDVIL